MRASDSSRPAVSDGLAQGIGRWLDRLEGQRWVLPLSVSLVLLMRNPIPVLRPEFYAEDGTDFFADALNGSFSTLWKPSTGYCCFLPRLIAYCASFFPVANTPFLYAAFFFSIAIFVTTYFSREGFGWLLPRRAPRELICLLLAVAPGTGEVFTSLSNLHNVLLFWLFLFLMEQPHPPPFRRMLFYTAAVFTTPESIILFPVVAWLGLKTKSGRYLLLGGILAAAALLNFLATSTFSSGDYAPRVGNLALAPVIVLENFSSRFLLAPLLGPGITQAILRMPSLFFWLAAVLVAGGLLIWWRRTRPFSGETAFISIIVASSLLQFALIAINRSYAAASIRISWGDLGWENRYAFVTGSLALLFWATALLRLTEFGKRWALVMLVWIALWELTYWKRVPQRPDGHWPEKAAQIQEAVDLRNIGLLKEPFAIPGIVLQPNAYSTFNVSIKPR